MGKKLTRVGVIASIHLLPLIALAQGTAPSKITDVCKILELVTIALNWFGIFVFIIAILVLLYAAFLFLTGGGNEETIKKARSFLIWGLIGIAVALFASGGIEFVINLIGGEQFTACAVGL
ncbi:MAG: hypothetical protein A3B37_01480 [Candidatus Sungbacteria bacterium RIFCSPLOWO2_01_FULL_59_16]|uniref:TrbC/VIRB2 family protein n=1 Tax=Candidatus Sungbacteria bacterium RIFCSPLOWO2_01_FULL_59_16 TaxID=1802280 RepID=A0A1G2LC29_9BACT|nr:MAG: hypothetical protein A3B37_01480 [Candidatus Sungbacteria bacterium RIFCSPLOWO2_01_FULL_59_16]